MPHNQPPWTHPNPPSSQCSGPLMLWLFTVVASAALANNPIFPDHNRHNNFPNSGLPKITVRDPCNPGHNDISPVQTRLRNQIGVLIYFGRIIVFRCWIAHPGKSRIWLVRCTGNSIIIHVSSSPGHVCTDTMASHRYIWPFSRAVVVEARSEASFGVRCFHDGKLR